MIENVPVTVGFNYGTLHPAGRISLDTALEELLLSGIRLEVNTAIMTSLDTGEDKIVGVSFIKAFYGERLPEPVEREPFKIPQVLKDLLEVPIESKLPPDELPQAGKRTLNLLED